MSTKNNKSTIAQTILEMDTITNAIKEESKKSLNSLLSEAVRNALREGCDEDEDKDYEVVDDENDAVDTEVDSDVEAADTDVQDDEASNDIDATDSDSEFDNSEEEAPEEGEDDEDWGEFSKYQVGDNTYDLTNEDDYENVVKVYKRLKDDDQVVVRKDGDKITLKDDSMGTEYVIDLGDDDDSNVIEDETGEEDFDSLQEGILGPDDPHFWPKGVPRVPRDEWDMMGSNAKEIEVSDDFDDEGFEGDDIAGFESDDEFEINVDDSEDMESTPSKHKYASDKEIDFLGADWDDEYDEDPLFESKKLRKNNIKENKRRTPMKGSKEVLFEVDLGYTDNYQDKDPIAGLSNNEPSKGKKSWHKGVPTGTSKPWAGDSKSKGEPFGKTVNEEEMPEMGFEEPVEEATNVGGAVQQRTSSKSHIPANRKEYGPKTKRHVSTEANYQEVVAENKKLKKENKVLKEALLALKGNLNEAYVTNVNLGKITKLFLENTTSQSEKIDIVNRFSNEAKTVEQSKALYESIKRELNKSVNAKVNINESMSIAESTINEPVYKSNELMKTIDLMNRMGC